MANELVTDKLWAIIAPHIPLRPRRKYHAGPERDVGVDDHTHDITI